MILNPIADTVSLANVECWQVVLLDKPPKKIDSRPLKRLIRFDRRPALSRKNSTKPRPIQLVNDPQSLWVSFSHEDTNCISIRHGEIKSPHPPGYNAQISNATP